MAATAAFKLRSELDAMVDSQFNLKNGCLSDPGFISEILAFEHKLESIYNDAAE